jgi:ectoine hydroxylase-related dioxygenase (phytanoyl-CoA dioxygenase family)
MTRLVRPVTSQQVEAYERDGVVCLRQVMPAAWLERMAAPIEAELAAARSADLSEMARAIEAGGGEILEDPAIEPASSGRFIAGTDHWRSNADFRAFATESPLAEIAAALMRSETVHLYEDSLLVKEPGSKERTAYHQDLAYFHVEGEQVCTSWCPLDPVTPETGAVSYVRGSHRWGKVYRPNLFVSRVDIPGTQGEPLPPIDDHPEDYDLVQFSLEPGDVTVHHARTLHGAGGNATPRQRRRAISVRYTGDDARFHLRPGAPTKPHHEGLAEGDALGGEGAPQAWGPHER